MKEENFYLIKNSQKREMQKKQRNRQAKYTKKRKKIKQEYYRKNDIMVNY